jgi:hypothetical protein
MNGRKMALSGRNRQLSDGKILQPVRFIAQQDIFSE